jgi:hypothetical protein
LLSNWHFLKAVNQHSLEGLSGRAYGVRKGEICYPGMPALSIQTLAVKLREVF